MNYCMYNNNNVQMKIFEIDEDNVQMNYVYKNDNVQTIKIYKIND